MKKIYLIGLAGFFIAATVFSVFTGCIQSNKTEFESEENDGYDGPDKAIQFEIERTKDPATGRVPWDKLLLAMQQTKLAKERAANSPSIVTSLSWEERGPNSDVTGPSNGNTRANNGVTAGRVRSLMVDSNDASHKTVWVGGVDGGLWKTTDITTAPANWILVNDFLSNLAVSAICQDPRPGFNNTMYFCTGESYSNADAVQGVGVFKSIDGGITWNFLPGSSTYTACTRILCDFQGNVYLATRNNGLLRSIDGGSSWTNITPTGVSANICDLEISSTSVAGRLHMTTGIFSTQTYRYTDIPSTVSSGSGWNSPTTSFPSFSQRAEIAVSGNVLYSLPCNASYQVPVIYKSTDGGDNWVATPVQPGGGTWANGQGWYSLSVGIDPSNSNNCIVGGLDCYKTTDGGSSWTKISAWVGTAGQYVHADQHNIQWWDGGNKLLFGCDGGVHFSSDGGTTIRDRNVGLRLKQFYSVAIHPTSTNYFLAGAQDNGVHQLNNPGLSSSVEVVGGDGCYVAIDQNEPQYQYGSYVYNVYRRSTNSGATWTTPINNQSTGRFVNPWDYDNNGNMIYACNLAGNYLRWNDPQTGASTSVISVPSFNGGNVSAVHASPYTANRVYFGTGVGRIVMVDNANLATPTDVNITGAGMPAAYVNCIVTGSSDQNLIACYSNFGVTNVWVTANGGTTWTGIDGNLPNMPVRWALFHPDDNSKAYIATETGVWETDLINGASTVWSPSASFPNVRTDMIKYRSADRTMAAGTHGRGVWTATVPPLTGFTFNNPPPATATCPAPASMTITLGTISSGGFTTPINLSASGNPGGTTVSFSTNPVIPGNSTDVSLNNTNTLSPGTYVITVTGIAGASTQTRNLTYTINPGAGPAITSNPASQTLCTGGTASFSVTATGSGLTYQWQKSTDGGVTYNNIAGATGTTYTIVNVQTTDAGLYRCIVSTQCGSSLSNAATLTINTPPAITGQPQSVTLCAASNNTFNVTATGSGLGYQWQLSTDGGTTFNDIGGATSSSYAVNGVTAGMNGYRYRVNVNGSCAPPVTSSAAILSVVSPVSVIAQPSDATVCDPGNTNFTVAGSGPGVIYQWQLSTDGGATYSDISNGGVYSGATTATLNLFGVTVALNGYRYRCLMSNSTCTTASITNAAILTVNVVPSMTAQPQGVTLCAGSNNTFNVTATGTSLSYQWQLSTDGGSTFSDIGGATSPGYTLNNTTVGMNNNRYRCVVSGACAPPAISNEATLSVIAAVAITTQPAGTAICETGNTSFSVAGNSTQTISYQWQISINGGTTWNNISGATTATLNLNAVTAGMNNNQYRCLLNNVTCTTPTFSGAAILTVNARPTVTLSASPYTSLFPGLSTVITSNIVPSATGFNISWFRNGTLITGVTGTTYTADVTKLGDYRVDIVNTTTGCNNQSQVLTIKDSASSKLFIYPSPNDGVFTVTYHNAGGGSTQRNVIVYDSKGANVYNTKFTVNGPYELLSIDLRPTQTGIYYVVVTNSAGKKLAEGKVLVH